jgi:hypothetical protein
VLRGGWLPVSRLRQCSKPGYSWPSRGPHPCSAFAHTNTPPLPIPRRRCRELLRDPRVKFCGYKHPHPLDNDILLRVQTVPGVTPAQALLGAATRLRSEAALIKTKFDDEMRRVAEEKARLHDDY